MPQALAKSRPVTDIDSGGYDRRKGCLMSLHKSGEQ
jgi:hypothetical protein